MCFGGGCRVFRRTRALLCYWGAAVGRLKRTTALPVSWVNGVVIADSVEADELLMVGLEAATTIHDDAQIWN